MVNIDITASGNAAAKIAEVQAQIDALHGKTVDVNIRTRGTAALTRGAAALNAFADAQERHGKASERAASHVEAHARASERARASVSGLGGTSDRAGTGLERSARGSDRARESIGGLDRTSRDADRSGSRLGDTIGGLGRSMGGLGDSVGSTSRSVRGAGDAFSVLGGNIGSVGNSIGTLTSGVSMLATVSGYATIGSAALTGAVGALGAVGVGALGAVGVAAGAAGGAMTSFTLDAQKDSARFGKSFEQMGKAAHLGAQYISEPFAESLESMGRALVSADNRLTPAGMQIANSLRVGFGEAGLVMDKAAPRIVEAAKEAAGGFASLTATAAPGALAFLNQLPELTRQGASGMSQITSEFGRSAAQIEGATPSFGRLMSAAGGLGAELMHIGAGSVTPLNENLTTMTRSATAMASQLEPAIKPSMQAFTDLADAGMGAIGALSPDIAAFAKTVSANAPGLQQGLTGVGRAMLAVGGGTVEGLASAGPALERAGAAAERNGGSWGRLVGSATGIAGDATSTGFDLLGAIYKGIDTFDQGGAMPTVAGHPVVGGVGGRRLRGGAADGGGASGGLTAAQSAQAAPFNVYTPTPTAPAARAATAGIAAGGAAAAAAVPANAAAAPLQRMIQASVQDVTAGASQAGSGVGKALAAGVGQGITTQTTVTDKIVRKHITDIEDIAQGAAGIHSPSRRFRKSIGLPIGQGIAGGVADAGRSAPVPMRSLMDEMEAKAERQRNDKVLTFKGGGKIPLPSPGDVAAGAGAGGGGGDLRGAAKRERFGELPGSWGPRMVFDKGVMSYNAKPGMDITQAKTMDDLRGMIESPLSKQQQTAMEATQKEIDGPFNRNYQMFGERTQQNILRGHAGALDIGQQFADKQAQQEQQQRILGDTGPKDLLKPENNPFRKVGPDVDAFGSVGGSGAGGSSYLGRDRIAKVNAFAQQLGANSAAGLTGALNAGVGAAAAGGVNLAAAGHRGYQDEDEQRSPSKKWAVFGGNSVAGLAGGMDSAAPLAASSASNLSTVMGDAFQSDRGLLLGQTFAQNILTGQRQTIMRDAFKASGLPSGLTEAAMASLAATGLLQAGGGAFVSKMTGNAASVVTLPKSAPVEVHAHFHLDDQVTTVSQTVTLDLLDKLGGSYTTQAG